MTSDQKADRIIAGMAAGTATLAVIPPVVDIAAFAAAIGGSVIGIGHCYGVSISKKEAHRLIMEFISFSGFAFAGAKFLSGILKASGLAYAAGGVIDAALYSTMSYAIGKTAKTYFKGEKDPDALRRTLRAAYKGAPRTS